MMAETRSGTIVRISKVATKKIAPNKASTFATLMASTAKCPRRANADSIDRDRASSFVARPSIFLAASRTVRSKMTENVTSSVADCSDLASGLAIRLVEELQTGWWTPISYPTRAEATIRTTRMPAVKKRRIGSSKKLGFLKEAQRDSKRLEETRRAY